MITKVINIITDIHRYPTLYELFRDTAVAVILVVLRVTHYLDWISQRSAEVWDITCAFVIKTMRGERDRDRERGERSSS